MRNDHRREEIAALLPEGGGLPIIQVDEDGAVPITYGKRAAFYAAMEDDPVNGISAQSDRLAGGVFHGMAADHIGQ